VASPLERELLQPLPSRFEVTPRSLAASLLERVQHIDCFRELGDVHDPVLKSCVDPYLPSPWSDGQHGFSVVRLEPLLDPLELKACEPPRILRKGPNVVAT
jgi:hypothetical protein